jgi:uncharacterized protein (DUF433 family)
MTTRDSTTGMTTDAQHESSADDPFVAEYPGVCGGYPVLRMTRIPVRIIVRLHRSLGDIRKIAELYPQLSLEQIQGALDYYAAHPARVDEDAETNARAFAELVERNVPLQGRPWPD